MPANIGFPSLKGTQETATILRPLQGRETPSRQTRRDTPDAIACVPFRHVLALEPHSANNLDCFEFSQTPANERLGQHCPKAGNAQDHRTDNEQVLKTVFF